MLRSHALSHVPESNLTRPRFHGLRPAHWPLALLVLGLSGSAFAQSVTFAGLPHSPLGAASLTKSGGKLVVAGIGSSGLDGVEIALNAAQSHRITFETPGAATLPTGAAMNLKAIGTLSGVPNQDIWTVHVEDVGTQFGVALDTSHVQAGSLVVQARLGGVVIASRTYVPPPPANQILATFAPEGCVIEPFLPQSNENWATIGLASSGPVTITGQFPVIADQVVLVSSNQAQTVSTLSATRMQAKSIPLFQISSEALGVFGHGHIALGDATMMAVNGSKVAIAGIGGTMQDGVEFTLNKASQADVRTTPISLSGAGAGIDLSSRGSFNGVANTFLGGATLLNPSGAAIEVGADFAPIGATMVRLEMWKNGAIQGSVVVPAGTNMATIAPGGTVIGCGKNPPDPPCIYVDFDDDVVLDPIGFPPMAAGKQLRILAENATGSINYLSSYAIKAANVPGFSLLSESPPAVEYGEGCPTVLGETPHLSAWVNPGSNVGIITSNGIPFSAAVLAIGFSQTSLPIGGCHLLVAPIATTVTVPLDAAGSILIDAPVSPISFGLTVYSQAFVLNPSALGFAASNGVCIIL